MSPQDENMVVEKFTDEAQIWWAAWEIADPGAANPTAVARTLFKASAFLNGKIGTDATKKHPALRVIAGQLASLFDVDSIGPSVEDLDKTQREYRAQKAAKAPAVDICPVCQSRGDVPCKERPSGEYVREDHHSRPHTVDRDFAAYGVSNV